MKSVRGPGGGYRLSRPRRDAHRRHIVAVDEPIPPHAATRHRQGCNKTGARCVTHDLWEELGQQIYVFLSSVSLADVVEKRVLGRAKPCNDMAPSEVRSGRNNALLRPQRDVAIPPESRDAISHALTIGGNPSSVHAAGRAAHAVVEAARDAVAKLGARNRNR